ncbi:hypothetical protein H310_03276 [Aphanomyces invadans]|uniref:Tudor domain-containing protein n=1 Tax=Aphanomyces invadans TaxID=157072 RepID=A0A024UH52_9STRA|nr:hypothetical protein H310_03276 [Aphanomyces invadans]ETW05520.1 hypothetical protein H310_03276 [Aphanomyces invadans]|eukprot:XP_008865297.1 hypothetical protein H310_03276 [Aphanomyces invadans]
MEMARTISVGTRVDGLYDGGDVWFPGVVDNLHGSTYSIQYDDGEREDAVPESRIRLHVAGTFSVGSRVLARYNRGEDVYGGVIADIDCDAQTYAISYDDGEYQGAVPFAFIVDESAPAEPEQAETVSTSAGVENDSAVVAPLDQHSLQSKDDATVKGSLDETTAEHRSAAPPDVPVVDEHASFHDNTTENNAMCAAEAPSEPSNFDTLDVATCGQVPPVGIVARGLGMHEDGADIDAIASPEIVEGTVVSRPSSRPSSRRQSDRVPAVQENSTPHDLEMQPSPSSSQPCVLDNPPATQVTIRPDPPAVEVVAAVAPDVVVVPVDVAATPSMIIASPPHEVEIVTKSRRASQPVSLDSSDQASTAAGIADEALSSVLTHQQEIQTILKTIREPVVDNDSMIVVKNALAQLLQQLRISPHVTVDCCREHDGELALVQCVQANAGYSILVCFVFVIVRRMCSVSEAAFVKFIDLAVLDAVSSVMMRFPHDAVLQASACGVLATIAQATGIDIMLESQVAKLIVQVLHDHQTLNHYSRQVHFYACEVLAKLCDGGDPRVLRLMSASHPTYHSPIHLFVFLLRQGHQHEDQKVACAACTLVLCLAARDRESANILRSIGALADVSTVMAKYPNDNGIASYSQPATREIALSSMTHGTTTKVQETAKGILQKQDLRLSGDLFESTKPHKPKQSQTKSSHESVRKQSKLQLKATAGGGDFTPSKTTLFSRNTMAPAPQLSHNVADSLTKIQQNSLKKPSTALEFSMGSSAPSSVKKPSSLSDAFPATKHTFTPFEVKLEKRLIQASHSKGILASSPMVSAQDRENILLRTYGVPTIRNIDRLRGLPTSTSARSAKHSHIEPSSSTSKLHTTGRGSVTSSSSVHEKSLAARPPTIPGQEPTLQRRGVAPRPLSKSGGSTPKKPAMTPSKPARATTPIKVVKQNLSKSNLTAPVVPPSDLTQLATQLFHAVDGAAVVSVDHGPVAETRLSFSDKLHEMIKKAEVALCRPPSACNLSDCDDTVKFDPSQLPPQQPPRESKTHHTSHAPSPRGLPPASTKKSLHTPHAKTTDKPPIVPVTASTEKKARKRPQPPSHCPVEGRTLSTEANEGPPAVVESKHMPANAPLAPALGSSGSISTVVERIASATATPRDPSLPEQTSLLPMPKDRLEPLVEPAVMHDTSVVMHAEEHVANAEPPMESFDTARPMDASASIDNLPANDDFDAAGDVSIRSDESVLTASRGAVKSVEEDVEEQPSAVPAEASYEDDDFEQAEEIDEDGDNGADVASPAVPCDATAAAVVVVALDKEVHSANEIQDAEGSVPDMRIDSLLSQESTSLEKVGLAASTAQTGDARNDSVQGNHEKCGDNGVVGEMDATQDASIPGGTTADVITAQETENSSPFEPHFELPKDGTSCSGCLDILKARDGAVEATPFCTAISPSTSKDTLLETSPTDEATPGAMSPLDSPTEGEVPISMVGMPVNVGQRYDAEELDSPDHSTTLARDEVVDSAHGHSEQQDENHTIPTEESDDADDIPSDHHGAAESPVIHEPPEPSHPQDNPQHLQFRGSEVEATTGGTSDTTRLGATEESPSSHRDKSQMSEIPDEPLVGELPLDLLGHASRTENASGLAAKDTSGRLFTPANIDATAMESPQLVPTNGTSTDLGDTPHEATDNILQIAPQSVISPRRETDPDNDLPTTSENVTERQRDATTSNFSECIGSNDVSVDELLNIKMECDGLSKSDVVNEPSNDLASPSSPFDEDNPTENHAPDATNAGVVAGNVGRAEPSADENVRDDVKSEGGMSSQVDLASSPCKSAVDVVDTSLLFAHTTDCDSTAQAIADVGESGRNRCESTSAHHERTEACATTHPVPPVEGWNFALLRAAEDIGAYEDDEFEHLATDRSSSDAATDGITTERVDRDSTVSDVATPSWPSSSTEGAQGSEDMKVQDQRIVPTEAAPTYRTEGTTDIGTEIAFSKVEEALECFVTKDDASGVCNAVSSSGLQPLESANPATDSSALASKPTCQSSSTEPDDVVVPDGDALDFHEQKNEPERLPTPRLHEAMPDVVEPVELQLLVDASSGSMDGRLPDASHEIESTQRPVSDGVGNGDAGNPAHHDIELEAVENLMVHADNPASEMPPFVSEQIEEQEDASSEANATNDAMATGPEVAPTVDEPAGHDAHLDDPYGDDFEGHDDEQDVVHSEDSATTAEAAQGVNHLDLGLPAVNLGAPKQAAVDTLRSVNAADDASNIPTSDSDYRNHDGAVTKCDVAPEPRVPDIDVSAVPDATTPDSDQCKPAVAIAGDGEEEPVLRDDAAAFSRSATDEAIDMGAQGSSTDRPPSVEKVTSDSFSDAAPCRAIADSETIRQVVDATMTVAADTTVVPPTNRQDTLMHELRDVEAPESGVPPLSDNAEEHARHDLYREDFEGVETDRGDPEATSDEAPVARFAQPETIHSALDPRGSGPERALNDDSASLVSHDVEETVAPRELGCSGVVDDNEYDRSSHEEPTSMQDIEALNESTQRELHATKDLGAAYAQPDAVAPLERDVDSVNADVLHPTQDANAPIVATVDLDAHDVSVALASTARPHNLPDVAPIAVALAGLSQADQPSPAESAFSSENGFANPSAPSTGRDADVGKMAKADVALAETDYMPQSGKAAPTSEISLEEHAHGATSPAESMPYSDDGFASSAPATGRDTLDGAPDSAPPDQQSIVDVLHEILNPLEVVAPISGAGRTSPRAASSPTESATYSDDIEFANVMTPSAGTPRIEPQAGQSSSTPPSSRNNLPNQQASAENTSSQDSSSPPSSRSTGSGGGISPRNSVDELVNETAPTGAQASDDGVAMPNEDVTVDHGSGILDDGQESSDGGDVDDIYGQGDFEE